MRLPGQSSPHTHTHKYCTQLQCHIVATMRPMQGQVVPKKPCTSHHKRMVQAWNAAARQPPGHEKQRITAAHLDSSCDNCIFGAPVSFVRFENASSPSLAAPQRLSWCGFVRPNVLHATFIAHFVATHSRSHINRDKDRLRGYFVTIVRGIHVLDLFPSYLIVKWLLCSFVTFVSFFFLGRNKDIAVTRACNKALYFRLSRTK